MRLDSGDAHVCPRRDARCRGRHVGCPGRAVVARGHAARGDRHAVRRPALTRASDAPYATGKLRKVTTLVNTSGTSVSSAFDAARRLVIETTAPPPDRRNDKHQLIDATSGKKIADVDGYVDRLSDTELVATRGNRQVIVRVADGSTLDPQPRLPNGAAAESTLVLFVPPEHGTSDRVWLAATANGHQYIGPWRDRSPRPVLPFEIVKLPTDRGPITRVISDGLELGYWQGTGDPSCPALKLHDTGKPECTTDDVDHMALSNALAGSWELDITDDAHPHLDATDHATGARQTVDLPCMHPSLTAVWPTAPRALIACPVENPDKQMIYTWTPAGVHVLALPGNHSTVIREPGSERVVMATRFQDNVDPVGDTWLDIDRGVALRGPTLGDLELGSGERAVATEGKNGAMRAVAVEADTRTIHDIAPLPCSGRILSYAATPRFAVAICELVGPDNDVVGEASTKLIDLDRKRAYDVPGHIEAMFADGTVVVSRTMRVQAETRVTSAEVALYAME